MVFYEHNKYLHFLAMQRHTKFSLALSHRGKMYTCHRHIDILLKTFLPAKQTKNIQKFIHFVLSTK